MPNGFHGSREEWVRMETPLLRIDGLLAEFAMERGLSLTKNYHSWPERSLVSTERNIRRLIQIYLENEEKLTLALWICVSEDRGNERFWKKHFLRKDAPSGEIENHLPSLLLEALEIARSWTSDDLEFAAKIKRHP
jgi:hypothetical protein